jgi:hypothetical protein
MSETAFTQPSSEQDFLLMEFGRFVRVLCVIVALKRPLIMPIRMPHSSSSHVADVPTLRLFALS